MERIRLSSDVDVKVMPRLEVLYFFVYELAGSFGAEEDVLDSIKTGIFENQILEQISIKYKNNEGKVVGKVVIDIDWEKHFCLAETEEGKIFEIDMSKSVVENIVGWKRYIVQHVEEIRRQFHVVKVVGSYRYRNEIEQDQEQYDKALRIMGHVIGTYDKEDIDVSLAKELTKVLEGNKELKKQKKNSDLMDEVSPDCGDLSEVKVTVYSQKNSNR